jgi:hypothetical protein
VNDEHFHSVDGCLLRPASGRCEQRKRREGEAFSGRDVQATVSLDLPMRRANTCCSRGPGESIMDDKEKSPTEDAEDALRKGEKGTARTALEPHIAPHLFTGPRPESTTNEKDHDEPAMNQLTSRVSSVGLHTPYPILGTNTTECQGTAYILEYAFLLANLLCLTSSQVVTEANQQQNNSR